MNTKEQLARVRRELEDAQAAVAGLAAAASDDAWSKRPRSGGWSAGECIAHLTITTDSYLKLFDAAGASIPPAAAPPSAYRRELGAALLEWYLEPPYRTRVKTIAEFVPGASAPKSATLADFDARQRALLDFVDAAESLALNHMIITSPFNSRLRYNAYAALRIITAHQRRHIWQAERALRGV